MKKRLIAGLAGAAALSASALLAPAASAADLFPAQNEGACAAYFGEGNYTYSNDQGLRTCSGSWTGEPVVTKEAGNSGRGWEVATTVEGTFTREGNDESADVSTDVTCTNPGGQEMADGAGQCTP